VGKIRNTNSLIEALIQKTGRNVFYINVYDSMTDKKGYPKWEFLESDGLHVNEKGYQLWKEIITKRIEEQNIKLLKAS
jgi:lysophospholipase L1-like esterase